MKTKFLFALFALGLGLILGLALVLGVFSATAQAEADRDASAARPIAATGTGEQVPICWDGALWHTEIVTDTGDVGYYTSLVLDSADQPHITYYDETSGSLRYAQCGQISHIPRDQGDDWGRHASAILDLPILGLSEGAVHNL